MTPTKRNLPAEKTRPDIIKPSFSTKAEIITPIQLRDASSAHQDSRNRQITPLINETPTQNQDNDRFNGESLNPIAT